MSCSQRRSRRRRGLLRLTRRTRRRSGQLGIGRAASPAQIAGWDIDVRADGQGLPPGHGSVREGEKIFAETCVACHGAKGEGKPADRLVGGFGTLATQNPCEPSAVIGPTPALCLTTSVAPCRSTRRSRSRPTKSMPYRPTFST